MKTEQDNAISEIYKAVLARPEHAPLTPEQEKTATPEELITHNLRFVVSHVGKNFRKYGLPIGDLISHGNVGLVTAAHKFDATRGFKFITYALWWINRECQMGMRENTTIRLPMSVWQSDATRHKYGDDAISKSQLKSAVEGKRIMNPVSVDGLTAPIDAYHQHRNVIRDAAVRIQITAPEKPKSISQEVEDRDPRSKVWELLLNNTDITERDKDIVMRLYGMGEYEKHTLNEIGLAHKISRERARQINEECLEKLRGGAERMYAEGEWDWSE